MKSARKTSLLILAAGVFVVSGPTVYRFLPSVSAQEEDLKASGYTIVQQHLEKGRGGEWRPRQLRIRHQSAKGDYRTESMRIRDDGGVEPMKGGVIVSSRKQGGQVRRGAGKNGEGVFLGGGLDSPVIDEEKIRANTHFMGEEEILGVRTLVIFNPDYNLRVNIAPDLGKVPIRFETDFLIIEPLSIVKGEPAPELFEPTEEENSLPIDTEGYRSLLRDAPKETTDHLRRALERFEEAQELRDLERGRRKLD